MNKMSIPLEQKVNAHIERVLLKENTYENELALGTIIRIEDYNEKFLETLATGLSKKYKYKQLEETARIKLHEYLRQNLIANEYRIDSYMKKFDTEITSRKPKTIITKLTDYKINLEEDPIFDEGNFLKTKLSDITRKTDIEKAKRKSNFNLQDLFRYRKSPSSLALFMSINSLDVKEAIDLGDYILESLKDKNIEYEVDFEDLYKGQRKLLNIVSFDREDLFEGHKNIYRKLIEKIADGEKSLQYHDLNITPGSVLQFWREDGVDENKNHHGRNTGLIYILPYEYDMLDCTGEYLPNPIPERTGEIRNYRREYEGIMRKEGKGTKVQLTLVKMPLKEDASDEDIVKAMEELKEAHNYVACAKL